MRKETITSSRTVAIVDDVRAARLARLAHYGRDNDPRQSDTVEQSKPRAKVNRKALMGLGLTAAVAFGGVYKAASSEGASKVVPSESHIIHTYDSLTTEQLAKLPNPVQVTVPENSGAGAQYAVEKADPDVMAYDESLATRLTSMVEEQAGGVINGGTTYSVPNIPTDRPLHIQK